MFSFPSPFPLYLRRKEIMGKSGKVSSLTETRTHNLLGIIVSKYVNLWKFALPILSMKFDYIKKTGGET